MRNDRRVFGCCVIVLSAASNEAEAQLLPNSGATSGVARFTATGARVELHAGPSQADPGARIACGIALKAP